MEQKPNNVLCIVQARMGSTRLPGKVLKEVGGVPLLSNELLRLRLAKTLGKIVVATGSNPENDAIEALCNKIGVDCFRGSEEDVLKRFASCVEAYPEYDTVVRITGDCPLIDSKIVDKTVTFFSSGGFAYASNVAPATFPDGMDVEVFSRSVLLQTEKEALRPSEREHVTLYIRENGKFKTGNLANEKEYSAVRLTVDNQEDFEVISFLIENSRPDASFEEYISLLEKHPEIAKKNQHIERSEGLKKSLAEDKE